MNLSSHPFIVEETLDDLMRGVVEGVLKDGRETSPHRGKTRELIGVLLELTNPRSRLSVTENRGHVFSCLGELLWYLAGSNAVDFITYYVKRYSKESSDGKTIHGAYGPRLYGLHGAVNQVQNILSILGASPTTRRAVIQLFDGADNENATDPDRRNLDVPCTNTLQFFVRDDKLHVVASMRSNDAFLGLPHDIFCFTMMQELFAGALGLQVGSYKHFVGSLHIYEEHQPAAEKFLEEGWQSPAPMPPMPAGDFRGPLNRLLLAESELRNSGQTTVSFPEPTEAYWNDLLLLLKAYALFARRQGAGYDELKAQLAHKEFGIYIDQKKQHVASRL
jgi:thymidylate synthase